MGIFVSSPEERAKRKQQSNANLFVNTVSATMTELRERKKEAEAKKAKDATKEKGL